MHARIMDKPLLTSVTSAFSLLLAFLNVPAQAQQKSSASAAPISVLSASKPQAAPAAAAARPQAEKVAFNSSSEMQGGKPLSLRAIWVRAAPINPEIRKPTIIAMHGCGGLYSIIQRDQNILTPRNASMARELRKAGYNVLMPDSLTPRGKHSICTESLQQRDTSTGEQTRDIQSALRWLAKQEDVDPDRIALLGWAHGGTAVMKALTIAPERGAPKAKAAVAFYPNCAQFNTKVAYKPNIPLLMLMGQEDDWAPVTPCSKLTEKSVGQMLKLNVYPDSYHEFDAPGMPQHVRLDVPNPQHPGQGVTSGTNPDAKAIAYRDMFSFLTAALN